MRYSLNLTVEKEVCLLPESFAITNLAIALVIEVIPAVVFSLGVCDVVTLRDRAMMYCEGEQTIPSASPKSSVDSRQAKLVHIDCVSILGMFGDFSEIPVKALDVEHENFG